ncbi:olfactory receptor 2AG2-like, partial [Emydura macquarii macquarii]|uniref:olfactory receptor 2AG2-like n=1 Tax=Emydura macquarii macquarii TaxID=1129001 RepID=UPI00352A8811
MVMVNMDGIIPCLDDSSRCRSSVSDFILLGFSSGQRMELLLLVDFQVIILEALLGSSLLNVLVGTDSQLHMPMYFFLANLSFLDIGCANTTMPQLLFHFLSRKKRLSYAGSLTQMYIFLFLGITKCILYAMTAYHRYVAICNPLLYHSLMNKRACVRMAAGIWFGASLHSLIHTVFVMRLPYCNVKEINHFFCEIPTLMKLSCSDISTYETVIFVSGIVLLLIPSTIILSSYTCILSSVLRMSSVKGMQKALATCSSHLTVVVLFYGAAIFMYMRPSSYHTPEEDKMVSMFYTIVTPVLNPLIYTLRNRDVLATLRTLVGKCIVCQKRGYE